MQRAAGSQRTSSGDLPAQWAEWDTRRRARYEEFHDVGRWRFVYDGPAAGSGDGHDISEAEATVIAAAFTPPVSAARVHDDAGLYDNAGICGPCGDLPYCRQHWHVTQSGLGTCPRGHGKSPDPRWSPDDW